MTRFRLSKPVIRPATRADLEKFYRTKTIKQTLSAWVAIVRGHIVACWGLAWIDGLVFVFCDLKPSARHYRMSIVRAGRAFIAEVRAKGCRVMYADRNLDEPGAVRWLKSLGFEPTRKPGLFRWQA